ncbi:glycosyl transferase [Verticillium alfalfae VaMs.102]|uniref:Glycosyl transferase n=1 Tax=Verticillium alfalfae (strain VaMs.102 / ATCC MYA-4576 / FGSC 10136) TaxID=526221 RepID=C9S5X4_VERA1|nr:glycosyl transferase [Verticillium alfalfae VaMs.102]EEY15113.1 glycosyl transferase [Verticillium alfalfae VaMs.102]
MTLDTALYKYWGVRDKLSEEKLRDLEHAKRVAEEAERQRKAALGKAWVDIMGKLLVVFGFATLFMWLLVDSKETTILYYCYIFGYTCALIFQFNRCFTTNVRVHVTIIICSALVGFVLGCLLHALPQTAKFLYTDVLCQNLAGALAAAGTSLFTWKDWTAAPVLAASRGSGGRDAYDEPTVTFQRHMMASLDEQAAPTLFKGDLPASFTQATVNFEDGTGLAKKMHEVLQLTVAEPNETARDAPCSADLLETALEMWTSGRLTAAVLSRQHFSDAGLEDCHSLSYSDRGVLHVAVCFTGETERRLPSWQPLLASVVCEALLYHVAATELRLPTAQAVQTEHMLHGTTALSKAAACRDRLDQMILLPSQDLVLAAQDAPAELYPVVIRRGKNHRGLVQTIWRGFVRVPALVVKNVRFRGPLLRVILLILKACWLLKNLWVYWLIVYHRPTLVKLTRLAKKGARRKIVKNTIVVELTRAFQTGFASAGDDDDEGMSLAVYNGQLTEVPDKGVPLFTTKYDAKYRLVSRHDTGAGTATYHYDPASSARRPETKEHVHKDYHSVGYYDKHGRIVRGTVTVDGVDFAFQYFYKSSPKGSAAMLHARFRLAGTGDSLSIYWGTPVDRNDMTWVPSKFIGLIVKKIAGRTYTTEYDYSHRRDPVITTFLEEDDGRRTALTHTPALFANEAVLLALPKDHAFDSDDLLVYHSPLQIRQMLRCARNKRPSLLSRLNPLRWLGRWNVRVYKPVPTWRIRTELWGQWLKTNDLDAVTACWVDELVLREEPLLKAYWRARDSGRLEEALRVLDANVDQIVSAIDIETDVSEVTLLSIKTADLYVMGLGKDANPVTTRPQDCYSDTKDRISVDEKVDDTEVQRDIVETFIPLLTEFVRGARTKRLARSHLVRLSNAMLSMAKYYEHKDYTKTWKAPEVEQAWIAAWLMPYDDDANMAAPSECFDIARPSMFDFRQSLNIYLAYFFIFAVGVPQSCPRVFQSTHHGISSLFGMVLKYRRGVTFGIWDHAILWRECCLNISPAQSELPVSVQSMLLAGIGLATRLAYFHTDVVMPCASLFNPMWEAEIGTDGARLCSRNGFRRKIDPIVNGISNMDAYNPVDKIRTETPTVVMLSNVQMIKGVKAAIQAADIIINRFGFTDYKLVVYGAKDRQPAYALEMEKLIVDAKLANHVVLAGFGNSKEVLKDAWLFMNSSISEGLPLAIGEAALAGVPIVATEVGATALVLTDPEKTDQRYGEVVPPNDPLALARAQVSMLAMVGPWARFTDQAALPPAERAPVLPDEIAAADVEWLTRRFYARADDRRKLGLLSRQVVLHSFHGSRYLREHEQMYWIQCTSPSSAPTRPCAPCPTPLLHGAAAAMPRTTSRRRPRRHRLEAPATIMLTPRARSGAT